MFIFSDSALVSFLLDIYTAIQALICSSDSSMIRPATT